MANGVGVGVYGGTGNGVNNGGMPPVPPTGGNSTAGGAGGYPQSPYASGFAGGSTNPGVFTAGNYTQSLNQNGLASMANMGQAPAFTQNQFNNAWSSSGMNNPQAWASSAFGAAPSEQFAQQMGLGGSVTALEQADPNSNLYQVPTVQAGQPYQHFMQSLNFGNGAVTNPAQQAGPNGSMNPWGYNNWNTTGAPSATPPAATAAPAGYNAATAGQGTGAYGGFNTGTGGSNAPAGGGAAQGGGQAQTVNGQPPLPNTFSSGPNPIAQGGPYQQAPPNQAYGSPLAGGYNSWGALNNTYMNNPYSYMTGQVNNGLQGGTTYGSGGPQGQGGWVPSSGLGGQAAASNSYNPLTGQGSMGGYGNLLNGLMGINPFTMGGYQSPIYNIGAPNMPG